MARDIIVRKSERIATLVHDEPDLKVKSLVALADGLFARSDDGLIFIGHLTQSIREDLGHCNRAIVVLMGEHRVLKTTEARLIR